MAICNLIYLVLSLLSVLATPGGAQGDDFPVLKGPYLGYEPPGETPAIFPFDLMPNGYRLHSAPAFTPDGKEVYFSAMDFGIRFSERIFVMTMSEGTWGPPEVAPFSGDYFDGSPSVSGDGQYLFFSSARTKDQTGRDESGDRTIWFVRRDGDSWSKPKPLDLQTPGWQNGTDFSGRGNLFFDSRDIYAVRFEDDSAFAPVKLGSAVNSDDTELHPCIAPDERFLVFYSNRPRHFGSDGGDLYISFKDEDGEWQEAVNLGREFNDGHLSTSFPRLSPDGKYFFFLKLVSIPWKVEVYWVSAGVLSRENFLMEENR